MDSEKFTENDTSNQSLAYISSVEKEKKKIMEISEENLKQIECLYKNIVNKKDGNRTCAEMHHAIIKIKKTQQLLDDYEKRITNLKQNIGKLKENQESDFQDVKLKLIAHKKVIKYFKLKFNLNMHLLSSEHDNITVSLKFEEKKEFPVKITFNSQNDVSSFEVIPSCSTKEYNDLLNWFIAKDVSSSLILRLRKYILDQK